MSTHSFKTVSFLFLGTLVGCSSEGSGGISADELEIVPRDASECATDRCGEYPDDGCGDWYMNDGYPDECMLDCPRGGSTGPIAVRFECREVHIVSCKELSNVVVAFRDGEHYKYDGLKGHYGTFGAGDKEIVSVWVKAGNNASGDGPGYGERFESDADCGNGGAGGTGGDDGMGGAGGAGASAGAGGMSGTGGKDCHCDCDDGDDDGDSDGYCDDGDSDGDDDCKCDDGVDCKVGIECPHGGKYGHVEVDFECHEAHIASCKELSNVVIEFEDGEHRKYDDLDGHCATLGVGEREILGVWVKAGNNKSGDGPGYGERFDSDADCDGAGGTGGAGGEGGMAGSGGVGGMGGTGGDGGMGGDGGTGGDGGMGGDGGTGGDGTPVSFMDDIQPYFFNPNGVGNVSPCTTCHSGDNPSGGVRLDSYANMEASPGPLWVAGDPSMGTLIPQLEANHRNGPDDAAFVDNLLSPWIDQGALDN